MNTIRKKIFAISGSTRKDSVNLHILQDIAKMYSQGIDWVIFNELDQLPHFNPDLDNEQLPHQVAVFRQHIEEADGIMICTPEYVFSLPGSLKNSMEWMVSSILLTNKPAALIVASSSGVKAFEALDLLMRTIGAKISTTTSLLIQAPKNKVTLEGKITDPVTLQSIKELMDAFTAVLDETEG